MRKKEPTLIITFHTTADAIALEKGLQGDGTSGTHDPCTKRTVCWLRLAWCTSRITQKI